MAGRNGILENGSPGHSQLVDQHGNPFEMELRDPDSPAYGGGARARENGVFALPHVLTYGSIWNSANKVYSWRWDEAYKTSRVDAVAMRRDAFIMGILQERRLASSQLSWHLEPDDAKDPRQKACAGFLTKIVEKTPDLFSMYYAMSDACWYGRYGIQHAFVQRPNVLKRPSEVPGPPETMVSAGWVPVNGDKIQFGYRINEEGETHDDGTPIILVHSTAEIRMPKSHTVMTDHGRGLLLADSYWREKFIIHKHYDRDDSDFFDAEMAGGVHGVGIRSRIYWLDWLRKEWLANVSDFIQRVGQGVLIFYYEAGNPQSEAQAIRAANNISNNTVIVWPRAIGSEKQGAGIDKLDIPMSGSETLIKLMEHLEAIIERYIIGQTGSSRSDTEGMGTHSGDAMQDTKFRLVKADAQAMSDSLTRDYITTLMKWNCPEEQYGMRFVFDVDKPNAEEAMRGIKTAWDMGAEIRAEDVYSATGTAKPQEGDEVLKSPQFQQQPGQPGMPGAGGEEEQLQQLMGQLGGEQPEGGEPGEQEQPEGADAAVQAVMQSMQSGGDDGDDAADGLKELASLLGAEESDDADELVESIMAVIGGEA